MDTPGSKPDQCVLYGATSASDGFSATISTSATMASLDARRARCAGSLDKSYISALTLAVGFTADDIEIMPAVKPKDAP